jgi:hypothetical protein
VELINQPAHVCLLGLYRRGLVILDDVPGASGDLFIFAIVFGPIRLDLLAMGVFLFWGITSLAANWFSGGVGTDNPKNRDDKQL